MDIGIIGNGFVGNAIYQNFKDKELVKVYDVREQKRYNTLDDTMRTQIVFVCLPTPMKDDGQCDLSYILNFFETVEIANGYHPLFVIKSTVPIGTTELLCN